MSRQSRSLSILACLGALTLFPAGANARSIPVGKTESSVELSRAGGARMSICIAPNAPEEVKALAAEFSEFLKKITGAAFEVRSDGSQEGILFGTEDDWPGLLPPSKKGLSPFLAEEDYLLKTEEKKVLVIGRTPHGLRNAMWDFLHSVGFRHFFPGPKWEIWPSEPNLSVSLNRFETPDYYTRRMFLGGSTWSDERPAFREWRTRNRMDSAFAVSTGHAYQAIIKRNKEVFDKHPEYTHGKGTKLDAANPEVVKLVVEDSFRQLEKNPKITSLRMDPSDGGGWPESSPLGSISNQALTLANQVAKAIQEKYPGRKVGMYAYSQHSPPPDIDVDPNVIINVATNYIRGGYTIEQLMEGWHKRGAEIGIREYLSVWPWQMDMPGRAKATNINYITRTIPSFYKLGARYWATEITNGWGPHGPGNYLAARLLWNVEDAEQANEILEDFYNRSFGPAAPVMKEFYQRYLYAEGRPLVSQDLIGRMYRSLDKALATTQDPAIQARIFDLAIYTRFVELMNEFRNDSKGKNQKSFDTVAQFAFRTRASNMVHSKALFKDTQRRQKLEEDASQRPETPVTDEELRQVIRDGIAANSLIDFEAVRFSEDLIPYKTDVKPSKGKRIGSRGANVFYLYARPNHKGFDFSISGGHTGRKKGPVKLKLIALENPLVDESVVEIEVPANREIQTVHLDSPFEGLHRLEYTDNNGATYFDWPEGQHLVYPMSSERSTGLVSKGNAVFFVPAGTKMIGGYSKGKGIIRLKDGTPVFDLSHRKEGDFYFKVEVPKGHDNEVWIFEDLARGTLLMTVPPYFARREAELLVPQEVLKKEPKNASNPERK